MKILLRPLFALALGCAVAASASAEIKRNGVIEGMEKVSDAKFQKYALYSIRIDEFGTGPDGSYQAIVTLRNESSSRVAVSAQHFNLTMVGSRGETIRNDGNLYQFSVAGSLDELKSQAQTIYLKPGKEAQVRVAFSNSKGFAPKQLKLSEHWGDDAAVTYKVG